MRIKFQDIKDVEWVKSADKKPYGCGAVYVTDGTNVYYGNYRFIKHFLDEGRWIIIGTSQDFTPTQWAEIPETDRELPTFKSVFNK